MERCPNQPSWFAYYKENMALLNFKWVAGHAG